MPYIPKTNWQYNDVLTEQDMNRIESGISESKQQMDTHLADRSNPHAVTAAQVGAIPTSAKGAASGVATLDASQRLTDSQVPERLNNFSKYASLPDANGQYIRVEYTYGQYTLGGTGSSPSKFGGGRGGGGGGGTAAFSTGYVTSSGSSGASSVGAGGNAAEYQTSAETVAIGCGTLANPPVNGTTNSTPQVSGINGAGGAGSAAAYDETAWTGSGSSTYHGAKGGNGGASTNGGGGGGGGAAVVYTYSGTTTAYQRTGNAGGTPTGNGGGLILIIAKGNIIVNTGGKITANGANGGNGGSGVGFADTGSAVIAYGGGGGGGCGGGCVYLLHKGTHSNSGSITVNGGLGGTRGNYFKYGSTGSASVADPGQPGTNGTIFTKQLT